MNPCVVCEESRDSAKQLCIRLRVKKRLVVFTTSRRKFSEEVRRLLLLSSLLSSLLSGWLSSCNFLRGLLSSFLCHSTFLQKKIELEWPSCRSLPGLKTNRSNHRPKHQIINVPMTKMMQIPFSVDVRLEVRCKALSFATCIRITNNRICCW